MDADGSSGKIHFGAVFRFSPQDELWSHVYLLKGGIGSDQL